MSFNQILPCNSRLYIDQLINRRLIIAVLQSCYHTYVSVVWQSPHTGVLCCQNSAVQINILSLNIFSNFITSDMLMYVQITKNAKNIYRNIHVYNLGFLMCI